jgi:hypothetical protein
LLESPTVVESEDGSWHFRGGWQARGGRTEQADFLARTPAALPRKEGRQSSSAAAIAKVEHSRFWVHDRRTRVLSRGGRRAHQPGASSAGSASRQPGRYVADTRQGSLFLVFPDRDVVDAPGS